MPRYGQIPKFAATPEGLVDLDRDEGREAWYAEAVKQKAAGEAPDPPPSEPAAPVERKPREINAQQWRKDRGKKARKQHSRVMRRIRRSQRR